MAFDHDMIFMKLYSNVRVKKTIKFMAISFSRNKKKEGDVSFDHYPPGALTLL